ncbi:MAG: hypothetical protein ACRELB_04530 [Polyangiaceae bacterium]
MQRAARARIARALLGLARPALAGAALALAVAGLAGCDEPSGKAIPGPEAAPAAPPPASTPAAPPAPPAPPEIIIDTSTVAVGRDHVPVGELGLVDKVAVFLKGAPAISGATVSVVAMRGTKPSAVAAVVAALHQAKAAAAVVKSDARDGTTQKVPVSFPASVPDCTTAAWIAKDASIDVWPAGGGTAHRVLKGLAGPDMTLGTEALRKQWSACGSSELLLGADDVLSWGLVFDLARAALEAAGTRVTTTVLLTSMSPGRKVILP